MTSHRKKLIEVALPLDAIKAASAREKSIRHGHPSKLHLWWSRVMIFPQQATSQRMAGRMMVNDRRKGE